MNKNINKKLIITTITILLCTTMLASLTPQTIAQTTDANQPTTPTLGTIAYANRVIKTTGIVIGPQYILGPFDGYCAFLYGPASITVQMNTYVCSGSTMVISAAVEKNICDKCIMEVYVSNNSNSGMTCIGSKTVTSQYLQDFSFGGVPGFEYVTIALISYPAGLYVDGIITY